MDHLSREELSQINRNYLQDTLCTKELYAPGASRANMGYDVDELDQTTSAIRIFWCNLPLWPSDKTCPGVDFPCCVEKRSETRRVQYARYDVGKLS